MKSKALQFVDLEEPDEYEGFRASDGWLTGLLQRNNLSGMISLDGQREDTTAGAENTTSDVSADLVGSDESDDGGNAVGNTASNNTNENNSPLLVGLLEAEEAIEQVRRFGESIQMAEADLKLLRVYSQRMRQTLMQRMKQTTQQSNHRQHDARQVSPAPFGNTML
jgi:hypothetical protein